MVKSMTGYGAEEVSTNNMQIMIEVKSVNHRFLDVNFHMPHFLNGIEWEMKERMRDYFQRGRIDVYITIKDHQDEHKTVEANWNLINQYMKQFDLVSERYSLDKRILLEQLTAIPDLFIIKEDTNRSTNLTDLIVNTIEKVSDKVLNMRQAEGNILISDIKKRINFIENMLLLIKEHRPTVRIGYQNRVLERVKQYTKNAIDLNDDKLHQEIVLLSEKGDISEEITRIHSHIAHLRQSIDLKAPIGRKLDFIIQELNREVNTIGSKSIDTHISQLVVDMKNELEKIKEQVQNIE